MCLWSFSPWSSCSGDCCFPHLWHCWVVFGHVWLVIGFYWVKSRGWCCLDWFDCSVDVSASFSMCMDCWALCPLPCVQVVNWTQYWELFVLKMFYVNVCFVISPACIKAGSVSVLGPEGWGYALRLHGLYRCWSASLEKSVCEVFYLRNRVVQGRTRRTCGIFRPCSIVS